MEGGDDVLEDEFLYMGTGETRGLLMVRPALQDHITNELHKEAQIMKERRKLHEERWFARGGRQQKKKGKGKGKDNEEVAPAGAQKT